MKIISSLYKVQINYVRAQTTFPWPCPIPFRNSGLLTVSSSGSAAGSKFEARPVHLWRHMSRLRPSSTVGRSSWPKLTALPLFFNITTISVTANVTIVEYMNKLEKKNRQAQGTYDHLNAHWCVSCTYPSTLKHVAFYCLYPKEFLLSLQGDCENVA